MYFIVIIIVLFFFLLSEKFDNFQNIFSLLEKQIIFQEKETKREIIKLNKIEDTRR